MVISTPTDLIPHQKGRQYDLIAALHLYGMTYDVPVEHIHRRLVQLLSPGGQLLYSAEEDQLMASFMNRDYVNLFRHLPRVHGTTSQIIENYPIGPDRVLFILTNNTEITH